MPLRSIRRLDVQVIVMGSCLLLAPLGVALMLAGLRVDVPMLRGGDWNGRLQDIAFLLIKSG